MRWSTAACSLKPTPDASCSIWPISGVTTCCCARSIPPTRCSRSTLANREAGFWPRLRIASRGAPLSLEDLAQRPREVGQGERLADHAHSGAQETGALRGVGGVAGDEQDRQGGTMLPREFSQLAAVEAGQANIGDQQVDPGRADQDRSGR